MGATYPASGPIGSNGQASVRFQNQIPGIRLEARQISAWTGQVTSAGTVSIWKNGFLVAPSAALTPLPSPFGVGAAAGGFPYIDLAQGEYIDVIFQGCNPGDIAYITVYYEEYYAGDIYPARS